MNVVFLSPHFPPSYYLFCVRLREAGANVLGLADEHFGNLRPELRSALNEYYRIDNLNDCDQALRALGYFIHRYGKIDRVAAHNEHWLELEGYLREQFNVPGRKIDATRTVKRKSLMKQVFAASGIDVARGALVRSVEDARALTAETGYPVVAKPDQGVGAAATYTLRSEQELREFFRAKPRVDYFMEAFITGNIVTFDGLVDHKGRVVFCMSLEYSRNIMEVVAEDDHIAYWTLRELQADLVATGTASVRAFDLREQFFHFEFFRTPEGRLLGLEINARPPGWPTIDMFNYAHDADAFREWANVVVHQRATQEWSRKYHVMFIGRKNRFRYRHSHQQVIERYGRLVVETLDMPHVFSGAMGQRAYLARSSDLNELREMQAFVQATE